MMDWVMQRIAANRLDDQVNLNFSAIQYKKSTIELSIQYLKNPQCLNKIVSGPHFALPETKDQQGTGLRAKRFLQFTLMSRKRLSLLPSIKDGS